MLYTDYFPGLVSHGCKGSRGKTQGLTSELNPQSLNSEVSIKKESVNREN